MGNCCCIRMVLCWVGNVGWPAYHSRIRQLLNVINANYWDDEAGAPPVRVPEGLKSSPSRVTQRVCTSLWNASDLAVAAS